MPDRQRQFMHPKQEASSASEYPPWLEHVSPDGSIWTVRDNHGVRRRTATIDFNVQLPDGSFLTHASNVHYLLIAQNYATLLPLHMPSLSAPIYRSRLRNLFVFILYLHTRSVPSLSRVLPEHVAEFQQRAAYGAEWCTRAPHRLYSYVREQITEGRFSFTVLGARRPVHARELYRAAGALEFAGPISSAILRHCKNVDCSSTPLPTFEEILRHENALPERPKTVQSIHRLLQPIEELWQWAPHISEQDQLRFRPFARGASTVASRLGVVSKRSKTMPPKIAFGLIEAALQCLFGLAPLLATLADPGKVEASEVNAQLRALRCRARFVPSHRGLPRSNATIGPDGLLRLIAVAAFVVIGAFSARRSYELRDLGAGCCSQDADKNYWLTVYIAKTHQSYDQIPVPAAVAYAVATMEALSAPARRATGTDSLWQMIDPQSGEPRPFNIAHRIDDFARAFCTERFDPDTWHFAPHQLRRFFAMLYFWRYERSDLAALSFHLRHFDLEMTRRYITDSEFGEVWREVESHWQAQFLQDVIEGQRSVGGKAGKRLKKEAARLIATLRSSVDVLAPQVARKRMERLLKRLGVNLKLYAWGTVCACPGSTALAAQAHCKGAAKRGPIVKNATEETCADCPFSVYTTHFAESLCRRLENRKQERVEFEDTLLGSLAESEITSLERVIAAAEVFPLEVGGAPNEQTPEQCGRTESSPN